ncbi:MAG: HugZ family protein [Acidobacteriaceae bacterium]
MSVQESVATNRHASTGPTEPHLLEPSHAERTRTLACLASIGTLSTMSRRNAGFPFGSLMPFALDPAGRPIFLISSMAMHTQNLIADPKCSLFFVQPGPDGDPLGAARATLIGDALPVPAADLPAAREVYVARHPNRLHWVDFPDFRFYQMQPADLYYVGGFGVMGWVDVNDYEAASSDPLATFAPGILAHMNSDHADSLILLARAHAGFQATEAVMTSIDRLGFTLRLKTAEGMKGTRINFPYEVRTPQETRKVLVEMVRQSSQGKS